SSGTLESAEEVPLLTVTATRDALIAKGENCLAEVLGAACVALLKHRPSVLVSLPQAESYAAALTALISSAAPTATWLMPVLQSVLDLRLSIRDRDVVARTLAENPR